MQLNWRCSFLKAAVIDIGTNSVKLLIGEKAVSAPWSVLHEDVSVTRLGEGFSASNCLENESMQRTASAVSRFVFFARQQKTDIIRCVGTMALRSAENSDAFIALVRQLCGETVQVLPGEREAELSALGVCSALKEKPADFTIFDTGGGSTELIRIHNSKIQKRISLNIGATQVTEQYFNESLIPDEKVSEALAGIRSFLRPFSLFPASSPLFGVGGGATTLASVFLSMDTFNADSIDGIHISEDEITRQITLYASLPLDQRMQLPGLSPQRAKIIPAGACIIKTILSVLNQQEYIVSTRGLRHGLMEELLPASVK